MDHRRKEVEVGLQMLSIQEGDHHVFYIPSLNVTSYGDSYKEARYMMTEIVLEAFFEDLFDLKKEKAEKTLYDLGWHKSVFRKKFNRSDVFVDKSGILQKFNLPTDSKIQNDYLMV